MGIQELLRIRELEVIWNWGGWDIYQFGMLLVRGFKTKKDVYEYIGKRFGDEGREK